mgnify:CR=1 FL=1
MESGRSVVVFDNLVYGHAAAVPPSVPLVVGDLGNPAAVAALFADYPIEAVLHFAACAYVGESVLRPDKYYDNNVVGSLNLLEASEGNKYSGTGRNIFRAEAELPPIPKPVENPNPKPPGPPPPEGDWFTQLQVRLKEAQAASRAQFK